MDRVSAAAGTTFLTGDFKPSESTSMGLPRDTEIEGDLSGVSGLGCLGGVDTLVVRLVGDDALWWSL